MIFTPACGLARSKRKDETTSASRLRSGVVTQGSRRHSRIALSPVYLGDYRQSTKPIRWCFTVQFAGYADRLRCRFRDALALRTTLLPGLRNGGKTDKNEVGVSELCSLYVPPLPTGR